MEPFVLSTSINSPVPRRSRRRIAGLLAAALTSVTALGGLFATAAPATADPQPACSWTVEDSDGVQTATLTTNFTAVLSAFTDGVWERWTNSEVTTGYQAPLSPGQIYRVYLEEPFDELTLDSPYVCQVPDATKTPQTITFPAPADMRYGDNPQLLGASVDSPLAVEYGAVGLCTLDHDTIIADGVGSCTVTASQPGDAEYAAATPVQRTFQITPAIVDQTIDFTQPTAMRVGDPAQTLDVSATSGLPVDLDVTDPSVCTVSGLKVTAVATGTCEITATQEGGQSEDGEFTAAPPVARTFEVAPRLVAQIVDFDFIDNARIGGAAPALDATATSGLPVTFTSTTPEVCDFVHHELILQSVGTCTIEAGQPGDLGLDGDETVEYSPAASVQRSFEVWPAPQAQTIDFPTPHSMRIDDPAQSLEASASSELGVEYTSLTPAVCTVSGGGFNPPTVARKQQSFSPVEPGTVTPVSAGTCTIEATQPGNADWSWQQRVYTAADPITRSFPIHGDVVPQTIAFGTAPTLQVGGGAQTLTATATSGLPVTLTSTTPSVCTVAGTKVTPVAAGSCVIEAAQAGNVGQPEAAHGVEYAAAPVVSTTIAVSERRTHQITSSGAHGVALSLGTGDVHFTDSAGLAVTVTSTTPKVCTWKSGQARLLKAGTCSLTATAAGTGQYVDAEPVKVSFPVWEAPSLPKSGKAPRVLDVLGRGEESLKVTATPTAVCRVIEGQVALTGAGSCRVTVSTKSGAKVRSSVVKVTEPSREKPAKTEMDLVGSVLFDYLSAELDAQDKRTLRQLAPKLRDAKLVVVYGNTQAYGAGDTPANRKLSAKRAANVVKYLRSLHVKAKATTIAMASRNPVGKDENANRRADIYWIP